MKKDENNSSDLQKLSKVEYDRRWRQKNRNNMNAHARARYDKNKDELKVKAKAKYEKNKDEVNKKSRIRYLKNKNKILEAGKIRYSNNKEKYKQKFKQYNQNNKEKVRSASKNYYQQNKKRIIKRSNEYQQKRMKSDCLFCAKIKIRWAVTHAFRRIKQSKPTKTENLLGCSWLEAKEHFEKLFKEGMTWENHGKWEIDHIRPVSTFSKSETHLINHITNLQPLWFEEHLQKSIKERGHQSS